MLLSDWGLSAEYLRTLAAAEVADYDQADAEFRAVLEAAHATGFRATLPQPGVITPDGIRALAQAIRDHLEVEVEVEVEAEADGGPADTRPDADRGW